jgi:hypothetical protein
MPCTPIVVQQPGQAASAAARISLCNGEAASSACEAMPTIGDDVGVSTAPPPRPARKSPSRPARGPAGAVAWRRLRAAPGPATLAPARPRRGPGGAGGAGARHPPRTRRPDAVARRAQPAPEPAPAVAAFSAGPGPAPGRWRRPPATGPGCGAEHAERAAQAELLAGELPLDDDFRLWLERQRRADQQAQREPVAAALAHAEQAGDLDAALAHARQLLTLDPSEEDHHLALMRVHYLRGEAATGLAAYQRCASTCAPPWAARRAGPRANWRIACVPPRPGRQHPRPPTRRLCPWHCAGRPNWPGAKRPWPPCARPGSKGWP